jgi:hypothetical protein
MYVASDVDFFGVVNPVMLVPLCIAFLVVAS